MKKEIIFTDRFLITKTQIIYQVAQKSEYFICFYQFESNFKLETYCDGISELNDGVFSLDIMMVQDVFLMEKKLLKLRMYRFYIPKKHIMTQ